MFKIVKRAIDEFNPFDLLPEAPNDEFDSESRKIAAQINDNSTIEEIAEIISKVLTKAFSEKFEIESCKATAEKIHKCMKRGYRMKFNGLIPELSVSDINKSKNFYINILGFNLEYERFADKFAFLSYGEAQIMIEEINGHWNTGELQYPFGRGVNFQIATDDVYKIANNLKQNNINLFRDITESRYECGCEEVLEKEILVQDPDGYLLRFSQTENKRDD